jgi:hypothetical protein
MALVKEVSVIGKSPCIAHERGRVAPTDNPRALIGDTIVQTFAPQGEKQQFFPDGQNLGKTAPRLAD